MAHPNYYYPVGYQPYMPQMQQPQMQQVQPQQQAAQNNGNNAIWVQGGAGAKAYPVAPNNSVFLLDSEESVMYIKTTDASGIPQPLRIFDYTERTPQTTHSAVAEPKVDVVTREEFERLREDVIRLSKGIRKPQVNNKTDKEG